MSPAARRYFGCLLPLAIAVAGCGGMLMLGFAAQVVVWLETMPDAAMEPVVDAGDEVVVNNTAFWADDPERGAVVNARLPDGQSVLRFVAGLPGETVAIRDGRFVVNDHVCDGGSHPDGPEESSCIFLLRAGDGSPVGDFGPLSLGEDEYFLLAEDPASSDSRVWGGLPRSAIYGSAIFRRAPGQGWDNVATPRPEPADEES